MMKTDRDILSEYAQQYKYCVTELDLEIENEMISLLTATRYLNKRQLHRICCWKSPRSGAYIDRNADIEVITKTTTALSPDTPDNERITRLCELHGVQYRMASVILYFAFPQKYPIYDFRVLWSLGWAEPNNYDVMSLWNKYCAKIGEISQSSGLDNRTVEKGLWVYSKRHQSKDWSRRPHGEMLGG